MDPQYRRRSSVDPNYSRHPGAIWIDEHRSSLPDRNWVAADGNRLVASAPSYEDLDDQLKSKGISPRAVAIAFICADTI